MGIKYKLRLKDLKIEYLIDYFKPVINFFKPKEKICWRRLTDWVKGGLGLQGLL